MKTSKSRHCETYRISSLRDEVVATWQSSFLMFFLLLGFILFTLTGCGHHHSGSIDISEEVPTLNLRGTVNLNNIKFPTSLCGNNSYQFIDLSVFNLSIQDDLTNTAYVSSNGEFSFSEMESRQQVVIFCTNTSNKNLVFEWMGASTSGLTGQVNASIDIYSTARSLIARTLRDRYGRRVKPEYITDEHIKKTVDALLEVIETKPELLNDTPLSEVESVKAAYTEMADSLNSGNSGAYPNEQVFIFYFAGDNNLGLYMEEQVKNIAEAGLPSDTQIIIGLDTFNSLPLLNKPGAARYKVNGKKLELLNEIGNIDSTDSKVLEKFVETTIREYPSKGYSLFLSSHGGGWRDRERINDSSRAVFMNDTNSLATGTILNTAAALETALMKINATNRKLDMIVFDACNLGCLETAYEFSNLSDYTVFSQALMPGPGIPYNEFFKEISNKGVKNLSAYQRAELLCNLFCDKYVDKPGSIETGVSIIDNSAMESFMNNFSNYIEAVYDRRVTCAPLLYNVRTTKSTTEGEESSGNVIQNFSPLNEFVDLKQLNNECHNVLLDVKIESEALKASYDSLIKYSKYSNSLKNANGLSITFPDKDIYKSCYNGILPADEYFHLKLNKLTYWNELLEYMLNN